MTSASDLESFLYQALASNARVNNLIESGSLTQKRESVALASPSIVDEFDAGSRVRAGRMGRIYELLFCLENSMRELIERTFREAEDFADWTEGIKDDILKRARRREKEDEEAPWHGPRGGSILSYLDFPQLGEIILDRWSYFEDLFGDSRWIESYFREMNPARRALAHTGDLTEFGVERMEMRVREWLMVAG